MNRKDLHNLLKPIATVRQLSNRDKVITEPTILLVKKTPIMSVTNSIGGWDYWDALCYVPFRSILELDKLKDEVRKKLKSNPQIEVTGSELSDFLDSGLKAYMSSIEFRIPKEVH